MQTEIETFESNRRTLEGIAYRMLGSLADAQDIVQDTFIKWNQADRAGINNPRAWLITVCSRLALNVLQSARSKRESYIGVWLPEPVSEANEGAHTHLEVDESVSFALLMALERLTPKERAAFVLHEVFDYPFGDIGEIIGLSSANCRQLASRARKKIKEARPRFTATAEDHSKLLDSFLRAAREGNLDQFKRVLSESIELHADGGGKVQAAREVIKGAVSVGAFFASLWSGFERQGVVIDAIPRRFNGAPGILLYEDQKLSTAITIEVRNGQIQKIFAVRNPEKLRSFPHTL